MTNDYPDYVNKIIPADLQDEMTDNRKESITDFGIAVMEGARQGAILGTKSSIVTVANNAITATATSATIDCTGFNSCLVSTLITGTGTWNVKLQGKLASDGTFMDMYDNNGNLLSFGNISASSIKLFTAIPDYIQVVATEVTDGATLTVKVQPINV